MDLAGQINARLSPPLAARRPGRKMRENFDFPRVYVP